MAYTKEQVARLQEFDEVTYAQAQELAKELGKTPASICSKVQHLGITYIKKEVPAPKPAQETKAELIARLEVILDAELPGLIGATREAIVTLLDNTGPATS